MQQIFEYVIVLKAKDSDSKDEMLTEGINIILADKEDTAVLYAARSVPSEYDNALDRIHISIRPFLRKGTQGKPIYTMGSPNPRSFARGQKDKSIKYYTRSSNVLPDKKVGSGSYVVSEGVAPSAYLMTTSDTSNNWNITDTTNDSAKAELPKVTTVLQDKFYSMSKSDSPKSSTTYTAATLV